MHAVGLTQVKDSTMTQASKPWSIGKVMIWSAIIILLAGCAANYARFQIDDQVEQAFKQYKPIDGFHYYYSGRENKPSAIIGIDPAYKFSSKFWTAIEPTQFKKMVDRMFPPSYSMLYGADILTPDGKRAGVWYSWVDIHSAKFVGDKIIVYSPEPVEEPDGMEFETKP
jgi:hypothetical protein